MPVYTGSVLDQLAEAKIDVALGRVTAAELIELGERLFRELFSRDSPEIEKLKRDVWALEDELHDSENEVDELERERDKAKDERDAALDEVKLLKKRIRELEGECV